MFSGIRGRFQPLRRWKDASPGCVIRWEFLKAVREVYILMNIVDVSAEFQLGVFKAIFVL